MTIRYPKYISDHVRKSIDDMVCSPEFNIDKNILATIKKLCESEGYSSVWQNIEQHFHEKVSTFIYLAAVASINMESKRKDLQDLPGELKNIGKQAESLAKLMEKVIKKPDYNMPIEMYSLDNLIRSARQDKPDSDSPSLNPLNIHHLLQTLSERISKFKPVAMGEPLASTFKSRKNSAGYMGALLALMDMNNLDYSWAGFPLVLQKTSDIIKNKDVPATDSSQCINARNAIKRHKSK
jgi:hypothetical protein